MVKQLLCFLLFSLSFSITAQNPNLRITLTGTPETCLNNGSLTWSTSGQDAGSTLVYYVYNNSTNTINTTTSSSTLSGLAAGSYRVVVAETIGSQSSQATSNNFNILNQKVSLTFTASLINNEICGNDGSFKVNVSSGRAPYLYQLLSSVDNSVLLEQPGDTFTNLKAGNYRYRVVDACGNGTVSEQQILLTPSKLTDLNLLVTPIDCSSLNVKIVDLESYAVLKYPLTIKASFTNPMTNVIEEVTVDNIQKYNEKIAIPFFTNYDSLTIDITITDSCGKVYQKQKVLNQTLYYRVIQQSSTCGSQFLVFELPPYPSNVIQSVYKVNFISTPAGFNPIIANAQHGNYAFTHTYGSGSNPLPAGTYLYEVSDACGRITQASVVVNKDPFTIQSQNNLQECGTDFFSIMLNPKTGYHFASSAITTAPQAFINEYGPLPFAIPESWYDTVINNKKRRLLLTHLPGGNYVVEARDDCYGDLTVFPFSFIAAPPVVQPVVTVQQSCGGNIKISASQGNNFKYQKYFPTKDAWGTTEANAGKMGAGESIYSNNIQPNVNVTLTEGRYRIIAFATNFYNYRTSTGKAETFYCDPVVLNDFVVGNTVVFNDANAFQCINGTYDVSLIASGGVAPLRYSIVDSESNNATVLQDNGINPVIEGLTAGIYFFRVTDNCGNFITRKMDIALLGEPGIRTKANCDTNELVLSIDNLDYLNFQWVKNDNPTTVLSTTNVLNLGEFTTDKAGEYRVRITSNSPTSCINNTYDITLRPDALTNVEAGTGQVVNLNYNGAQTKINLFDYLTGVFDTYGTWTETTTLPSNLLANNEWYIQSAQAGTYTFKYTVSPLCGGVEKSSLVTINLAKVCYKPAILTGGGIEETKFGITLLGRAGADKDNWPMVRKGGWMALESNTKGFVPNRISFDTNNLPVGIPPANFVEGMMVFDTTNDCMKIYNGTVWSCFSTQTCPE